MTEKRKECSWWRRATQAEAERDEWRQTAKDEHAAALDLLGVVKERDARIGRLENRAASEAARADTWRERCRDNQGRVRRAARVIADVRTERNAAFTRIQAVRDVLDEYGDPEIWAEDIRRALDGDA